MHFVTVNITYQYDTEKEVAKLKKCEIIETFHAEKFDYLNF